MMNFYKGRIISEGTLVFVYFNLHKNQFSVKALEGEHNGKVVMHLPVVTIKNVKFIVNETGRQRVLEEKKKNVHAGVVGHILFNESVEVDSYKDLITYNPYTHETFQKDGKPIYNADFAYLTEKKIYI